MTPSAMLNSAARRLPGASTSYSAAPVAQPHRHALCHSRRGRASSLRVLAVNHDPEGLFKNRTPEVGIIARRMQQKMMQQNKEYAAEMQRAKDDIRRQVLTRRAARTPPTDHTEMIEFLLNTEAEDMEWEVARCRPQLTVEFFRALDGIIGRERFAAKPDEERLFELDTLRKYLEEAVEAVDKAVTKTASAADRLKKLLSSKDKKQMILDMAAANEIDQALVDLLTQNIEAAKAAEQQQAVEFMEKVKVAVSKYLVKAA